MSCEDFAYFLYEFIPMKSFIEYFCESSIHEKILIILQCDNLRGNAFTG